MAKQKKKVVDREAGGAREVTGTRGKIISIIAIAFSLVQIYMNSIGTMQEIYRNAIHLTFLFVLGFLMFPATSKSAKDRFSIFDILLAILGIAGGLYIVFFYQDIHGVRNSQAILQDYVFAVLAIVLTLEAARRTIGLFVPLLSIFAIIYALYGPYFPGMFAHAGFSVERLLFRMYMTTEGLLGMTIAISSTYIFLFILFGAFLQKSGAAQLFNDLSTAIAGRYRGGPAKVAVVSSGMMGMLNGSAVANVATTGSFTIPLMKSIGYKPRFAGAVEAAASTGGMIMPPIMGAAAFIMVGFLGVPYSTILIAGIVPALLYYISILIMVDIEAKRLGLKGLSKEMIPRVFSVLKARGALLLPIIIVVWALMTGKTPLYAGFIGIISTIVASWFNKKTRIGIKELFQALELGAKAAVQVGIATACGIIVGVVAMTSVGSTLAYNITQISGGMLPVTLILIMVTSIVLSLGGYHQRHSILSLP
ncbi:TRAP transporter fused permease subunit [Bacillus tianshenii]|nr:TRAP transporter fused permease subunit [Bacillus tianshenii]